MTIRKLPDTGPKTGEGNPEAEQGNITLAPAGLPSRNPTKSYWLREPEESLLGYRGTADLPETADVVVVGSGITGAFAARFLLEAGGGDGRVVMLEAREACAGATGRNGGHCQPLVYGSVPAVGAFELEVFEFMERFVREEGVDCDWVTLPGVHAFLSKGMFDQAAAEVAQLQRSHPELGAHLEVIHSSSPEGKQALAALRVPTAHGAIIQKSAASLWPYKLVASILSRLITTHPAPRFNLQTNTPVTSLSRAVSGPGWTLTTPRGTITANQVLLATNGYTSHLLPAFSDLIVPVRGQIGALLPPPISTQTQTQSENQLPAKLTHSYAFAADPDPNSPTAAGPRDDYLVQRPLPRGEMIYGGGRRFARAQGVGEWRDDEVEGRVAAYLRGSLSPVLDLGSASAAAAARAGLEGEGEDEKGELEASFEWTGVMGYSRDQHAWVGAVPESLGGGGAEGGLFVCAGYTGHGMPAAALSAREVVRLMVGEGEGEVEEGRVGLPDEFALNEDRVAMARGLPHMTQGWEATNFAALMGGLGMPDGGKGM